MDTLHEGSIIIPALKVEIIENKVVSIEREEDIIIATSIDALYIETNIDVQKSSFQSLSLSMPLMSKRGLPRVKPYLSKSTNIGLKLTIDKGAWARKGLEKHF